eukprot:4324222-Prymnesium_polylepis.1
MHTALEARTLKRSCQPPLLRVRKRGLSHSVCPVAFIPQHQNCTRLTHRRLLPVMTTDRAILLLQASARGRAVRWRM